MTDWKTLASAHASKQLSSIPSDWILDAAKLREISGAGTPREGHLVELDAARKSGLLSEEELTLTQDFSATNILKHIRNQKWSAEEVTVAFCKRAALAQQLTSCLTEIFFDEGIARARWLDQQLRETGKVVGPLHGLPISLKDCFHIKGHYATAGYVEYLKRPPPTTNAALVQILLDAGAVLYCKTNVPQTMMTADSENNIFGRTLNPHNTSLTAGGSSGGEGALVSFRGSPLGIGNDLAGSVRIPALCCGVYGFKPTANRIPFAGQTHYPFPVPWLSSVMPVIGPLANSLDDLSLFMETVSRCVPWKYDAMALNIPWRSLDAKPDRALTIGVMAEDPDYPLHPPVRRALTEAASILRDAGHTVVDLPASPKRCAGLGARIGYQFFGLSASGAKDLSKELGEPLVTSVASQMHPFSRGGLPVSPELGIPEQFHGLNVARIMYAEAWKQIWLDNQLDVVLAPGAVSTAVPHDTYGIPVYTVMWSVLDYPAAVIPFGKVCRNKDPESQAATTPFVPDYTPEAIDGAPCSLQIVTPTLQDEECLNAANIIQGCLSRGK
ncbi:Amidase [Fusarium sp. LHS14.1]|nr:Amidase [Fusarium sp. LHS14.1]